MVDVWCKACACTVGATVAAGSQTIQLEHYNSTFGPIHVLRGPT